MAWLIAAGAAAIVGGLLCVWWPLEVLVVLVGILLALLLWIMRRKFGTFRGGTGPVLLEVLLLPLAMGLSGVSLRLALVATGGLAVYSLAKRRTVRGVPWVMVALLAASVIVWLQSPTRAITVMALFGAVVVLSVSRLDAAPRRGVVTSLVDGLGLFLIANVLAYLAGLQSTGASARLGIAQASGGPFGDRLLFPLSFNAVIAPTMGAAFIAGVAALSFGAKRPGRVYGSRESSRPSSSSLGRTTVRRLS